MKARNLLIVALMIVSLGGAYWLGTRQTPKPLPDQANQTNPHSILIPTEITLPASLPTLEIGNATKVLTGEVKVPDNLLTAPPPAKQPEFIVPDLGK